MFKILETQGSSEWNEEGFKALAVTNLLFQKNDINPCIYKLFLDTLDLEQR